MTSQATMVATARTAANAKSQRTEGDRHLPRSLGDEDERPGGERGGEPAREVGHEEPRPICPHHAGEQPRSAVAPGADESHVDVALDRRRPRER
jgi:hypothetical protein